MPSNEMEEQTPTDSRFLTRRCCCCSDMCGGPRRLCSFGPEKQCTLRDTFCTGIHDNHVPMPAKRLCPSTWEMQRVYVVGPLARHDFLLEASGTRMPILQLQPTRTRVGVVCPWTPGFNLPHQEHGRSPLESPAASPTLLLWSRHNR